jgi:hypothetical protein
MVFMPGRLRKPRDEEFVTIGGFAARNIPAGDLSDPHSGAALAL